LNPTERGTQTADYHALKSEIAKNYKGKAKTKNQQTDGPKRAKPAPRVVGLLGDRQSWWLGRGHESNLESPRKNPQVGTGDFKKKPGRTPQNGELYQDPKKHT